MDAKPEHDILAEGPISLSEAARCIPGAEVHPCTIWRWCHGHRGVRLEHVMFGRKILTSRQALTRFAYALAELDAARQQPPPDAPEPAVAAATPPRSRAKARPSAVRERDAAATRKRLIDAGILNPIPNPDADAA